MKYRVILADPPWRFSTWSNKGRDRCPETRHYETMSLEEIAALQIPSADSSFLFLWAYQPMLPDSLRVMEAWEFRYVTIAFVWVKTGGIGHGYYTRSGSELCLLGRKGNGRADVKDHSIRQVIETPRREHSRKPDEIYDRIECLLDGPYLELFARTKRAGWDAWGDQAGTW